MSMDCFLKNADCFLEEYRSYSEGEKLQKSSNIGGQAVMEGIMMRNKDRYSVAVRKPDKTIEIKTAPYKSVFPSGRVAGLPIIRGVIAFIDSIVVGTSSLMWSAEFAGEDAPSETGGDGAEKNLKVTGQNQSPPASAKSPETVKSTDGRDMETAVESRKKSMSTAASVEEKEEREWKVLMTVTVIISVAFSIALFVVLPYFLAGLFRRAGASEVVVSLAEAVLRIVIFLLYMFLISRMKDIQRVFAYHGAEHKCINCIENGLDLNVENVMKSSRQHKRCGTSFLLIVIVISVIAFLILGLFGIKSPLWRLLSRLILIPVIAGISYEFLRVAGSSDNRLVCTLSKPGLALQKLVTREPSEDMAEVAIAAVNAVFDWKKWQGK